MPSESCVNKTVLIFGVFELIFGFGVLITGILEFVFGAVFSVIGHGIWGGVYMMTAALFAVLGGCYKNSCLHITHMVLAILACVIVLPIVKYFCAGQMVVDVYAQYNSRMSYYYNRQSYNGYYPQSYNGNSDQSYMNGNYQPAFMKGNNHDQINVPASYMQSYITEAAALTLCALSFVIFIISASFTCCAVCSCCGAKRNNGMVYPQPTNLYGNPPMMMVGYSGGQVGQRGIVQATYA